MAAVKTELGEAAFDVVVPQIPSFLMMRNQG